MTGPLDFVKGGVMLRRPSMSSKLYEFETPDMLIFHRFLKTLDLFHIPPVEEYGETYYDFHGCKFCATKKERLQIEYVFRRMISLDKRYLMDLDGYQNRQERFWKEYYAIY